VFIWRVFDPCRVHHIDATVKLNTAHLRYGKGIKMISKHTTRTTMYRDYFIYIYINEYYNYSRYGQVTCIGPPCSCTTEALGLSRRAWAEM